MAATQGRGLGRCVGAGDPRGAGRPAVGWTGAVGWRWREGGQGPVSRAARGHLVARGGEFRYERKIRIHSPIEFQIMRLHMM